MSLIGPGRAAAAGPPEGARAPSVETLAGRVRDPGNRPIRNALVVLRCPCLPRGTEAQTDDLGGFRFEDLAPGSYTLEVLAGSARLEQPIELVDQAPPRLLLVVDPRTAES